MKPNKIILKDSTREKLSKIVTNWMATNRNSVKIEITKFKIEDCRLNFLLLAEESVGFWPSICCLADKYEWLVIPITPVMNNCIIGSIMTEPHVFSVMVVGFILKSHCVTNWSGIFE